MKRLIPAAVLFILIICVCIVSIFYTNRICDATAKEIKHCLAAFFDGDQHLAIEISEKLKEDWHKSHKKLSVFVNHRLLDEVTVYVEQIPLYAKMNYDEKFYSACQNADTVLEQIIHEEKFKISCFY